MHSRARRLVPALIASTLVVLLSACLLNPGKFTSRLELREAGTFSFSYDGQIYLLALSKLAQMGGAAEETFSPQPCYDEETFDERDCTEDELAQQRQDWEAAAQTRAKEREQEAATTRAMLGGIDPADPKAAEELADRLRRQAGWKKVEFKGDGLFEVSFAITGRLDHDFVFPTIERFPMTNAFVQLTRREGATVRVDAPAFAAQSGGNPFQGMMAGVASAPEANGQSMNMPEIDGTFTVVTDGEILANNTDEGATPSPAGQVLEWKINPRTASAPTALIRISP